MKISTVQRKPIGTTHKEPIDFIKLNELIAFNIENILDYYSISHVVYPNRVTFPCPIHNSDRAESLNVFTSGNTSVGNFVCWTGHCESDVGHGVINLIKYIAEKKVGHKLSIREVISQIENITGKQCPTEIASNKDIRQFNNLVSKINTKVENKILASREYVKSRLTTEAKYYINRGYAAETLKNFDVGLCVNRGTEMFMRVVVPVYDVSGKYLIGCVGRSINPECVICNRYHAPNRMCPTNGIEERWSRKWVNSTHFNSGNSLYNLWNAADIAKEKQKLILVEGQGDVWRLYESGINNAVGLFGNKLTDNQFAIIESLGVTDIYIALDVDEQGIKGRGKILEKLSTYYNIHEIDLTEKDVGEMSPIDIITNFRSAV